MRYGNAKIKLIASAVIAILLLSLVATVFALFSRNIEVPSDGETAFAEIAFSELELSGAALFADKGDTYTKTLTVENKGSVPLRYTLGFSIVRGGLEKAVLIYLDGKFLGTLDGFFAAGTTAEIAVDNPLCPGAARAHTLTLEYHLGANSYYSLTEKDFSLTVSASARQIFADTDKYLFAASYYELSQILNNYAFSGYTVQLTADVTLQGSLTVSAPLAVNLGGWTLTLGNYNLVFGYAAAGVSRLYNSEQSGGVVQGGTGNIVVNTPEGYVRNEIGADCFTVTVADETVFVGDYEDYLDGVLWGTIAGGTNLVGIYGDYIEFFEMVFSGTNPDTVTSDMQVVTPEFSTTLSLYFGFAGRTLSYIVKVGGSDADSVAETVIRNNFYLLPTDYTFGTPLPVAGDVLLPTRDRQTGNPITWISSARDILDETGKYNIPYINTSFELSAIVTVNGVNILKIFPMTAIAKSSEEKLREMLLERGKITFLSFDHAQPLINPLLYEEKMGLTSITYTIPANVDTVLHEVANEVQGYPDLKITGDPGLDSTYIEVAATFGSETVIGRLNVVIDIIENISYHSAAFRLVMSMVELVDENTLKSFELPSNYRTATTIEYIVSEGTVGVIYNNPVGVAQYVVPKSDNTGITIVKEKLPQENTTVTVAVKITHDEDIQYRYFQISVAGVLHYSPEDIEDINLYQELRKLYDTDDDWILTRDEIDAAPITAFKTGSYHNIVSIKGIEFFTKLTSVYLNNNNIIDITPLAALYNLTDLNLSFNSIQNIDALKGLEKLTVLNLANNDIRNIAALKNKEKLETLTLRNNLLLGDLSAVAYMPKLESVYLLNTLSVTSNDAENNNALLSAYQNAQDDNRTLYIYKTSDTSTWSISGNLLTANTVANYIEPIYEFYNVLYLPAFVKYNNTNYAVTWKCSIKDEDIANIVKIEEVGKDPVYRAYITQPAGNTDVKLSASVTHSNATIIKFFDVVSRKSFSEIPQIYKDSAYVSAIDEIPDEQLRRYLFKMFDFDGDNYLSFDELNTSRGNIDLSGLGIASLKGIQYFSGVITSLALENNSLENYDGLEALVNINTLSVNGNIKNLLVRLPSLTNLTIVNVYGLTGINSEAGLLALYNIYKSKANATIYKDSTLTPWNPYIEPMAKALGGLSPYVLDGETHVPQYLLYAGGSLNLETSLKVIMYDGAEKPVDISYVKTVSGHLFTLNGNTSVSLAYSSMPSVDEFGQLTASITLVDESGRSATVARVITVVSVSDTDLHIQDNTGALLPLTEAVPNAAARRSFISRLSASGPSTDTATGKKYLPYNSYINMWGITFTGPGEYGLKGMELLKGGNVTNLTVNGYTYMSSVGFIGLEILNSTDFPGLVTINLNNSIVNLFDIAGVDKLVTLSVANCVKAVMDRVTEGTGDRISVFGSYPDTVTFPKLNALTLNNCNISDFWAIQELSVYQLYMHSNPVSTSALTNYYVEEAYSNRSLGSAVNYRIINNSTQWTSSRLDIKDLNVTYGVSGAAAPYPYGVNYIELGAGEKISFKLPRMYNSVTENVFWSAIRGGSAFVMTTYASYKNIEFSRPSLATQYTVIRGTVKTPEDVTIATIDYIFVNLFTAATSDTVGYAKTGSDYYLDIRYAFMVDGRFADYHFAYYLLGLISDDSASGLFKKSAVEVSNLTVIRNASNNSSDAVIFNDIKGIRYFTGVTEISLDNHTIADISELFYLQNLRHLSMFNNRIQSLKTSGGQSVFHNMANLEYLRLYLNQGIDDFSPIVDRASASYALALTTIIVYQGEFAYYPAVIDDGNEALSAADDDPEKMWYMAKTWWDRRKAASKTTDATLQIVAGQSMTTYTALEDFFDNTVEALATVARPTDVKGNSNLGASVTYNGVIYQLKWYAYGSSNAITVDAFGKVTQLSTELSYTNHWLKMRVAIMMGSFEISRLIHIKLASQEAYNDENLLVELNADEATKYQQKYGYAVTNSRYDATYGYIFTVKATDVIPDANFRNYMFSRSDTNTKDGTITMAERQATTSTSLTNRAIDDITGFELFYRVSTWTFEAGQMKALPELFIRNSTYNGSTSQGGNLTNLYLRRYYNLTDLQTGLGFDGDGSANNDYVSLYNKLLRLEVQNCPNIDDTEYAYIASMPNLIELNVRYNRYSRIDVFHDLYDTITRLYVNNNNAIYANQNTDQYRRLVLDSPTLLYFNDISYVNTVFKEYLALEPYKINVPKALPSTFQLKGYDRVYNLSWSEIVVGEEENYYTISENGGVYYLTVETGAPPTVNARVSVSYTFINEQSQAVTYTGTYSEAVEIITLQDADLTKQYYRLEGTVWTSAGDADIATVVPDPMLRYYFFKVIDTDGNGYVSQAELGTSSAVFNEGNPTIYSLEGIDSLYNLESLTVNRFYGYDLSPLQGLSDTLTSLSLTSAGNQLTELSLFDDFPKLTEINLNGTGVLYFGFVMNNEVITTLRNVTASLSRYSVFSRNAWAYARMYNDLSDVGANLGTDNGANLYYTYINSQDEKYASCILNAIDIDMQTGDVFEAMTDENNKLVLPPQVLYQGNPYEIEWLPLSDNLAVINGSVAVDGTVTNGELEVSPDAPENLFGFVARVKYNGSVYERLFAVRYQA